MYNQVIELLPPPSASGDGLLARIRSTRRGRLLFGFAPAAAVCVALEIIILFGRDSFAGPLGIGGALAVPIITGVFPMLLVFAARRKGEYVPGRVIGVIGHPLVVTGFVALFVLVLILHGLVIWDGPFERASALIVATAIVLLAAWTWRSGAFRRRAVVELRRDRRAHVATLSVTTAGRTVVREPWDATSGGTATATVPAGAWRELRVWPHEVSADGWSTSLEAEVEVNGKGTMPNQDRQVLIPTDGTAATVLIRLGDVSSV
jgi:hypothetical protein